MKKSKTGHTTGQFAPPSLTTSDGAIKSRDRTSNLQWSGGRVKEEWRGGVSGKTVKRMNSFDNLTPERGKW